MNNPKNVEELNEKIEVDRELLSTMPKNNQKNIEKYEQKVEEMEKEYEKQRSEIYDILNKRYDESIDIECNPEIKELDNRLQILENVLYLLNENTTSYEKMNLDRMIYKLRKYYKGNLEIVNEQISNVLTQFIKIGIELTLDDFDYSIFVKQYMEVFLEEYKNKTLLSDRLKNKFEEIYWKCPEIIVHIELNIRNIYLKNQAQIDKYYNRRKEEILKKWDKTIEEIMKTYMQLSATKKEMVSKDKKIILEEFLDGNINVKNYENERVFANLKKLLPEDIINNIKENKQEVKQNVSKFLNSLYEYKNYEEFKFIINDVKIYYEERENYKSVYEETKKKIEVAEKKLKKLNKKSESGGIFSKKNTSLGLTAEQNDVISELKDLYRKLDLDKFYNKIYDEITDNSTIYDVLSIASSYYEYLTTCIIKNDKTITQVQIDEKVEKLNDFLKNPHNTIINNMTIMQEKDIGTIIKDRYKLLNFNIEKEDLEIDNVDNLITNLEEIEKSFNIEDAGLNIETIEELVDLKKLLKR